VENNPYDPSLMVFMDYRDCFQEKFSHSEQENPTFLYAMPMSSTRVFFEETCLASKDAMPFDVLKKRLMYRLDAMGVRILKVHEEEWSYIPVGGSLPNTDQKNLAFGAAASMVHPATGYSVVRSLSGSKICLFNIRYLKEPSSCTIFGRKFSKLQSINARMENTMASRKKTSTILLPFRIGIDNPTE